MDIEKYISSGILELYVAGALSPEENLEVQRIALEYPKIQREIEAIEKTVLELSAALSPGLKNTGFESIRAHLDDTLPLATRPAKQKNTLSYYLGWAASIILAVGLLWVFSENKRLKSEIQVTQQERKTLKEEILEARKIITEIGEKERLLNEFRNKDINVITLGGQKAAPNSYAKAYWNKPNQKVFIDAQGLPEPPSGFTYQVWSLKLDPLTPTSIGLLADFQENSTGVFELENPNESEAFGITLEPEGGSESPNLEQLYTLGAVGP